MGPHSCSTGNALRAAEPDGPSSSPVWSPLPLHPLLFAAFPVLFLYCHNIDEVTLREVVRPLFAAVAVSLLVFSLLAIATRKLHKAAAAASLFMLALFSYGHITNVLPSSVSWVTAPLYAAFILISLTTVLRSRRDWRPATHLANLIACVLLAPSVLQLANWHLSRRPLRQAGGAELPLASAAAGTHFSKDRPDIYYIVLDAYAGDRSLKEIYGFDNSQFLIALRSRGFALVPESRSNYPQTVPSLSSSLNMRYLLDSPANRGVAGPRIEGSREAIDNNAVARALRREGYRYVYVWSGTAATRLENPDRVYAGGKISTAKGSGGAFSGEAPSGEPLAPASFERQVLGLTALDPVEALAENAELGAWVSEFDRHRSFINSAYEGLAHAAEEPGPKFVFAHISAPHPPFVFLENGEPVDPRRPYVEEDGSQLLRRITKVQYRAGYVAQLQYVNRRTLAAMDAIVSHCAHAPIIIVQGDHGSRMNLDWQSIEKTDLREPFCILNAIFAPPRIQKRIYTGMTLVNTFRVLLSELFGTRLPLLADRSFQATVTHPRDFVDVTDGINHAWLLSTRGSLMD